MSSYGVEDDYQEDDDAHAPTVSGALKSRLETSVSALPSVPEGQADNAKTAGESVH
jgi:hypothetical protein